MAFPSLFLDRLTQLFPESELYDSVLQSFSAKKNIAVRINTLKTEPEDITRILTDLNITFSKVPWYPNAFLLESISTKEIADLPIYKEGKIYIQSLSSMIPALILNPTKDEKVLDIAAAPGSKTTQMAAMMNNEGKITANDMSHERLYKLKANLTNQGVTNTNVTNYPGQTIWQKYPEYFDKVLVDVPCSMEGRFDTHDPETYGDWSMKKIKRLSKLQKWLLRAAVSATKRGGTIVYSTCTLAPEENEEVINWIFDKESKSVELENISITNLEMTEGLTSWQSDRFSSELKKTKRLTPSNSMEGFYVAKIKKIHSNVQQTMSTLFR